MTARCSTSGAMESNRTDGMLWMKDFNPAEVDIKVLAQEQKDAMLRIESHVT